MDRQKINQFFLNIQTTELFSKTAIPLGGHTGVKSFYPLIFFKTTEVDSPGLTRNANGSVYFLYLFLSE